MKTLSILIALLCAGHNVNSVENIKITTAHIVEKSTNRKELGIEMFPALVPPITLITTEIGYYFDGRNLMHTDNGTNKIITSPVWTTNGWLCMNGAIIKEWCAVVIIFKARKDSTNHISFDYNDPKWEMDELTMTKTFACVADQLLTNGSIVRIDSNYAHKLGFKGLQKYELIKTFTTNEEWIEKTIKLKLVP